MPKPKKKESNAVKEAKALARAEMKEKKAKQLMEVRARAKANREKLAGELVKQRQSEALTRKTMAVKFLVVTAKQRKCERLCREAQKHHAEAAILLELVDKSREKLNHGIKRVNEAIKTAAKK